MASCYPTFSRIVFATLVFATMVFAFGHFNRHLGSQDFREFEESAKDGRTTFLTEFAQQIIPGGSRCPERRAALGSANLQSIVKLFLGPVGELAFAQVVNK